MKRAFGSGKTLPSKKQETFDSALLEILGGQKDEEKMEVEEVKESSVEKVEAYLKPGVTLGAAPLLDDLIRTIHALKLTKDEEKDFLNPYTFQWKLRDDPKTLVFEKKQIDERQHYLNLKNWQYGKSLPLLSNLSDFAKHFMDTPRYNSLIEDNPKNENSLSKEAERAKPPGASMPLKYFLKYKVTSEAEFFNVDGDFAEFAQILPSFIYTEYPYYKRLVTSLPIQLSFLTIERIIMLYLASRYVVTIDVDLNALLKELALNAYKISDIKVPNGRDDLKLPFQDMDPMDSTFSHVLKLAYLTQAFQENLVDNFLSAKKNNSSPTDEALFSTIRAQTIDAEYEYQTVLGTLQESLNVVKRDLRKAFEGNGMAEIVEALKDQDEEKVKLKQDILQAIQRFPQDVKKLIASVENTHSLQRDKLDLQRKLNEMARELDKARRHGGSTTGGQFASGANGKKDMEKLNAQAAKIQRESILTMEVNEVLNGMRIYRYLKLVAGYLVRRNVQSLMLLNLEDILFQRVLLRSEINSENDMFFTIHLPGELERVRNEVKRIIQEEKELYKGIFETDRTDFQKAGSLVMTPDTLSGRERAWSYLKTIIQLGNSPKGSSKVSVMKDGQISMEFLTREDIPELIDAFAQLTAANMTHLSEIQKMRATTKSDKIDIGLYMYAARERMRHVLRFHCGIMVRETDTADFIAEKAFF